MAKRSVAKIPMAFAGCVSRDHLALAPDYN